MNYRRLGRTGLEVSEVGFGAWGIGRSMWIGAEDKESLQALERAIDLGLNFIDTALAYGEGRSERLVGQVVRERGETVHVATKVPPKNLIWPAEDGAALDEVFPPGYVRECAEQSLRNLEMDTVDLLQLHVWNDDWADSGELREELDELRSMAERAREIVISTPRCGCALGEDADALLTSTREAVDAYAASSMPAWMTLRSEQVQRISKLADSVERSLLRCLSSSR